MIHSALAAPAATTAGITERDLPGSSPLSVRERGPRSDLVSGGTPHGIGEVGAEGGFALLIRRDEPRLRALAFRLLGDRDEADDALQDAYVRAYRALGAFRGDSSFSTWIYRITYNTCVDALRRRRVSSSLDSGWSEEPDTCPEPGQIASDRADLSAALAALPPGHRAAVLLVDAEGYGYEEASTILGVPVGTIASRLSRARASLRRVLARAC